MRAISRGLVGTATGFLLLALAAAWGCGARQPVTSPESPVIPTAPRQVPLSRVIVLETSGPPPPDTSVTFTAGSPRTIVLYHAGENITFASLRFEAGAFADSGQAVRVDVRPRPGIYGLDIAISLPLKENQAAVIFEYSRYFSAPARARQVFGSDIAFERALAVGRLLPDGQVELLPSTRPATDNLRAALPAAGSYVVGAPH
jgi:hypothetical protein